MSSYKRLVRFTDMGASAVATPVHSVTVGGRAMPAAAPQLVRDRPTSGAAPASRYTREGFDGKRSGL